MNEDETVYTAGDCKYFETINNVRYYPHNFRLIANNNGAIMACAKCGTSFILGTDRLWHQFAFGFSIPDLVEAGVMEPTE